MSTNAVESAEQALFEKIRLLRVRALRPVRTWLAGAYASAFRGPGIEFEELRHYEPGDEVRLIDWRAMARFAEPYVKRFVEPIVNSFPKQRQYLQTLVMWQIDSSIFAVSILFPYIIHPKMPIFSIFQKRKIIYSVLADFAL